MCSIFPFSTMSRALLSLYRNKYTTPSSPVCTLSLSFSVWLSRSSSHPVLACGVLSFKRNNTRSAGTFSSSSSSPSSPTPNSFFFFFFVSYIMYVSQHYTPENGHSKHSAGVAKKNQMENTRSKKVDFSKSPSSAIWILFICWPNQQDKFSLFHWTLHAF